MGGFNFLYIHLIHYHYILIEKIIIKLYISYLGDAEAGVMGFEYLLAREKTVEFWGNKSSWIHLRQDAHKKTDDWLMEPVCGIGKEKK